MKTCIRDWPFKVSALVHFKMKFSTVRETLFKNIFIKKNFWRWAIFSSVFQCNIHTPFYVDFRRFTSLGKKAKMATSSPTKATSGGGGGNGSGTGGSSSQTSTRTPTSDFYRLAESGSSKALTAFGLAGKGGRESRKHRQGASLKHENYFEQKVEVIT